MKKEWPELLGTPEAKKVAAANAELTQWMQANVDGAQKLLIAELKEETKAKEETKGKLKKFAADLRELNAQLARLKGKR